MSDSIKQPFPVTKPGEVVVPFAGKVYFTNDAGGRYDHCAAHLFRSEFKDQLTISEQLNAWAIANPKANIVHMQPMGENALLILYNFVHTPEEIDELDWTHEAVTEFMAKKRAERAEQEAQAKKEKDEEEMTAAYYRRTGEDFHKTKALIKAAEKELGGAKKEELKKLYAALHNGELFAALGVEVPAHLRPAPAPAEKKEEAK